MKKAIISVIIGLPICVVSVFLVYYSFFGNLNGFEPVVIMGIFIVLYMPGGFIIFPLLILGVVLGIKSIRERKTSIITYMGIITNCIALIIGILVVVLGPDPATWKYNAKITGHKLMQKFIPQNGQK